MSHPPFARSVAILALVVALLLMIPLVAMRFTDEVRWTGFDFIVAGALLFGAGLTYLLVSRRAPTLPTGPARGWRWRPACCSSGSTWLSESSEANGTART